MIIDRAHAMIVIQLLGINKVGGATLNKSVQCSIIIVGNITYIMSFI